MEKQLKTRQICLFFLAFLPVIKLLKLPSVICYASNEDGWLSASLSLSFDFITLLFLLITSKRTNKDFFTLLKDTFGEKVAKGIFFLYAIFFSIKSIVPLNDQNEFIDLTLYMSKPSVIYFTPIYIFAFYMSTKKLRVLGRLADIFWLLTLTGILLILALSVGNADFSAILPIGANGYSNIFLGTKNSLNWFGDSLYFLFFLGNYEKSEKSNLKIILAYLTSSLCFVFFMVVFYGVFSSISGKQIFALTDISKYSTVINNTSRFDYIAITLLLISNVISLSLPIFFASKCLDICFEFKKIYIAPLIICLLVFIVGIVFNDYYFSIENSMKNGFAIMYFAFSNIIPCLSFFLTLTRRNYATITN